MLVVSTSFSSDNSYRPTIRRSSPVALRQLIVRDLDENEFYKLESIIIKKTTRTIPNSKTNSDYTTSIDTYTNANDSLWTTDSTTNTLSKNSLHYHDQFREEHMFLNDHFIKLHRHHHLQPPPIIQYQIAPVPFRRPSPYRYFSSSKTETNIYKKKLPDYVQRYVPVVLVHLLRYLSI